jgi:glycosyltransferase involved in cell wall biosynthesis
MHWICFVFRASDFEFLGKASNPSQSATTQMHLKKKPLVPLADRGPLRVMFVITSMPVGGAETLLANLCRRLDPECVLPELCCLKEPGPLGESLRDRIPVHARLLRNKWDGLVLGRLRRLFRERRTDAVISVGAGDKMFWGRLAAWLEGVPVIGAALHSTGWPDGVGYLNRLLTPLTDAFIAVAQNHGRFLVTHERFPASKVRVIANGVDTERFRPRIGAGADLRTELGAPSTAPLVGIVAALRPEKNHELFLRTAAIVRRRRPDAQFVIVGDGPERQKLEQVAASFDLNPGAHFLGSRSDIPQLVAGLDLFALTSHNEANPVSILEALACGVPVVSTRVGSVEETVREGITGFLVEPGDADQAANRWLQLINDRPLRNQMGDAGRRLVIEHCSLEKMVAGYQQLIRDIYSAKVSYRTNVGQVSNLPGLSKSTCHG